MDSKEAMKAACVSEKWEQASLTSEKADAIRTAVLGNRNSCFWKDAEAALKLVQPVSDAIHQIEADKPLLSSIHVVYKQLTEHAKVFMETQSGKFVREDLEKLFRDRFLKHKHPAMPAAFLLDPSNFKKSAAGKWVPHFDMLTPEECEDVKDLIARIALDSAKEDFEDAFDLEWSKLLLSPLPTALQAMVPYLQRRDEGTGGVIYVSSASERIQFWDVHAINAFPIIAKVAVRLLSMHSTTCATERNWSIWGALFRKSRSRLQLERAEKLVFLKGWLSKQSSNEESEQALMLQLLEGVGLGDNVIE
jgi:hypothetical protein